MKKMAIVALLATTASFAQARDNSAQAWEFRRSECEFVADRAADAYKMRIKGVEFFVPNDSKTSFNGAVYEWANEYAQGRINGGATSLKDAISKSYAKCIDNIDNAYFADKEGGHLPLQRLQ